MTPIKPKKNPPAFPMPGHPGMNGPQEGMSLRDWFAGMALQGMLATQFFDASEPTKVTTERCYKFADAMIARRGDE